MTQLSVEDAFAWAQRFAAREWRLLVPVALAFLGLPGLLFDIFLPNAFKTLIQANTAATADQGIVLAALSLMLIVNMMGWLAIAVLALIPGVSVREAIVRAGRRLPALVGATLLWCAALLFVMVALALLLIGARAGGGTVQAVMIAIVLIAGTALWVRLLALLPAWMAARRGGPVEGLRGVALIGRGVFWRLLGALGLYMVGSVVVLVAVGSAAGAMLTLAAQALGQPELGRLLPAILVRTLGALISMGLQLLAAGLYRQLASAGGSDMFE